MEGNSHAKLFPGLESSLELAVEGEFALVSATTLEVGSVSNISCSDLYISDNSTITGTKRQLVEEGIHYHCRSYLGLIFCFAGIGNGLRNGPGSPEDTKQDGHHGGSGRPSSVRTPFNDLHAYGDLFWPKLLGSGVSGGGSGGCAIRVYASHQANIMGIIDMSGGRSVLPQ